MVADTKLTGILLPPDDHASRPAATDVVAGTLYPCTDHELIYQSDGATWSTWASISAGGGLSSVDEWVNRANTSSLNGVITFSNVTRVSSGGPSTGGASNGAYLQGSNGSGSYYDMASIGGLDEGDLVAISLWCRTDSGGGTFLFTRTNADGPAFTLPHLSTTEAAATQLSGTWLYIGWTTIVGSDGTVVLRAKYQPGIADIRVRKIDG